MDIEKDLIQPADQANLKISYDAQSLSINHKLYFKDKSIWGVGLFLIGGIFFILIPLLVSSDTTSKFLGILAGSLFLVLSIITIIRQASDYVKIIPGKILFQYNLKKSSVLIDKRFKIKMKMEHISVNRASSPVSSTFILVTCYLQTVDKEIPLLNFQMKDSETEEAKKLGNKITQILNERISI
jgi:hypothetical protein